MSYGFYDQHCNWIPQGSVTEPQTDDPAVLDQVIGDRPIRDYTPVTSPACDGHRTDNTAGYVVRHTITGGQRITRDGGRVGVDVFAVACTPTWGNYDKAIEHAYTLRGHGSYAVVDTLYRCGHRSY